MIQNLTILINSSVMPVNVSNIISNNCKLVVTLVNQLFKENILLLLWRNKRQQGYKDNDYDSRVNYLFGLTNIVELASGMDGVRLSG